MITKEKIHVLICGHMRFNGEQARYYDTMITIFSGLVYQYLRFKNDKSESEIKRSVLIELESDIREYADQLEINKRFLDDLLNQ